MSDRRAVLLFANGANLTVNKAVSHFPASHGLTHLLQGRKLYSPFSLAPPVRPTKSNEFWVIMHGLFKNSKGEERTKRKTW